MLLMEHDGKKFVVEASKEMMEVRGLGVVDGSVLCSSSFGDIMRIGGHDFFILRPSVRDLLTIIERRAQIILPKDSFCVPMHLDIGAGSRVIEGGAGSGAMTVVLLRAVYPNGKVTSYEMRDDFAALAKRNIATTGLTACWELRMDDICSAELERGVDAVFLDIPNPWDAVDNVVRALKPGGHVCCYIPNANQLFDVVTKMRDAELSDVHSFETIQREMVVHEGGVRPSFDMLGHTGYLAFGRRIRF